LQDNSNDLSKNLHKKSNLVEHIFFIYPNSMPICVLSHFQEIKIEP
jgi:hypothetical protein